MTKLLNIHYLASILFLLFCFLFNIFIGLNAVIHWPNIILFIILFMASAINPPFSLGLLSFFVPFTSNIYEQIKAILNIEVLPLDLLSMDASIGFLSGIFILSIFTNRWRFRPEEIRGKIRVFAFLLLGFHALIIITSAIAISRNLYQAASPFSIKGLFYNLANIRYLSWHDDYFPLRDIFVFTTAIALSIRLLTLVRTKSQLMRSVLAPLFAATVIILSYALWSKLTGIGYNTSGFVQGVNSFFPDIHAYGGYALTAFVGGLYYLSSSRTKVKLAAGAFSLLAAVGVVVSGSRFSIAMLFVAFLIYISFFITKKANKSLLSFGFITLASVAAALLLSHWGDRGLLRDLALMPKAKSFAEINVALSYRPEIFRSALLMYSQYPILGLGKGIFYRQSSIGEFSKSNFFANLSHGENAHNYLLQIITETGIVGFSIFCAIFIYQALYLTNRYNKIVTVLIFGSFLGNLYGHSLLIHNMLVLLFILLGAVNVEVQENQNSVKLLVANIPTGRMLLIATATLLVIGAIIEVKTSYGRVPFQQQFVCYKNAYYEDNQTGGLFGSTYKVTGNSLKLEYYVHNPDVQRRPLTIYFTLEQKGQNITYSDRTVNQTGSYKEAFDISKLILGSDVSLQIRTSRCFTPINLGVNMDKRRLGIQLIQVFQDDRPKK